MNVVVLLCFVTSFLITFDCNVEASSDPTFVNSSNVNQEDFIRSNGTTSATVAPSLFAEQDNKDSRPKTYIPGLLTVHQAGLTLSEGLSARIIATSGQPVQLLNGETSKDVFHEFPDGAAVFEHPDGGWIYVSNAESMHQGGVGALYFDAFGRVVDYKRLLQGTTYNCAGGKTFWNTWLSCEEVYDGQVWEVNPITGHARKTLIGGQHGNYYESVAYDNRNVTQPKFYVTVDSPQGAMVRYTPDADAVSYALSTGNYTNLLHTNTSGTARMDYLVLVPNHNNSSSSSLQEEEEANQEHAGTFYWTDNQNEAETSASLYYPNTEGLDARNGILYMTAKNIQQLFILDIDSQTYTTSSTVSGMFSNQPDQIQSVLGQQQSDNENENGGILYFCEDGLSDVQQCCGVYGRNGNGLFFTILHAKDAWYGETTGLAFAPHHQCFYVSFQEVGNIVQVCRQDGYEFGGQQLDIRYHYHSS